MMTGEGKVCRPSAVDDGERRVPATVERGARWSDDVKQQTVPAEGWPYNGIGGSHTLFVTQNQLLQLRAR